MKVAEVTAFGGPEGLRAGERPEPTPGPGEVVVRIHAAAVNPTDIAARAVGNRYIPDLRLPFVPGWDLAGVVSAVGEGASGYAVGDRVCGMIPFGRIGGRVGAYAQAAAVQPEWLAPLPGNVSFEVGATLPLNALTAHQALAYFAPQTGGRLLVTGASGGVGGFAVELAVRAGWHVVAVAGRDDQDWVRGLGAHEVLPRDADLTRLGPLDAVLDAVPVGPERSTPALRDGGTAVFTRPPQPGASYRHRFETVRVETDPVTLGAMARMLGEGALHTRVSHVLSLGQAAEAHRLAEAGGLRGKVVLRPWDD
ncbi:NADP-dependent oxidoreductase [Longimicrobium sp.]|uniref:NADP-dependent oxidoreductase n=1 Tax=Longimicrobium sp. TaxID=2029185 RepID=UPI002E366AF6|nr:NADP-dependent oxidoreductase [Longimicrobium sp.]HEX6037963.1 NADP-dependent oxidoreductase [Longimicrobium sp.]